MAFRFLIVALAVAVSNVNSACLYAPPSSPCAPASPVLPPGLPSCYAAPPIGPPASAPSVIYVMTLPAPAPASLVAPPPTSLKKKYPKFESETSHVLPLEVPSSIPVGQFCSVQKVALQPNIKSVPADFEVEEPAPVPAPCDAPVPAPCAAPLSAPCAPRCS